VKAFGELYAALDATTDNEKIEALSSYFRWFHATPLGPSTF
jgi:hypothetical protein